MKQHINSVSYKLHAHLMPINIPSPKITFIQIIKIVCKICKREDILCDIKFRSKIFCFLFSYPKNKMYGHIYIYIYIYIYRTNMYRKRIISGELDLGNLDMQFSFSRNVCQKALLLSRQLRNVYYTCAILYVLWDMRNRYVFVS